ncbi:MAG TPA: C4-type zinc ribbon domain-containing protein, partial [Opitutales bacterium]|nr:C4-type zinc ribbon domain-containing protein [Opitutales bacterium]
TFQLWNVLHCLHPFRHQAKSHEMPDPNIESLLILQDRDHHARDLERQLTAIPQEIAGIEVQIAAEKERLDSKKERIRSLEVQRKDLEGQISVAENQIVRLRNQQLEVKKNEEYQALTKEIETAEKKIGTFEEQALEILFELDEERERIAEIEKDFADGIEKLESKIDTLKKRIASVEEELGGQRAKVEEARGDVADPKFLAAYDQRVKLVKFPVIAPVVDRACQGCHLRVSGEIETSVREKGKITTCDSCGRILYSAR